MANLANNHILDCGEEGLRNTLKLLNEHGVYYMGAGLNENEAKDELIIEVSGKRIGFLGFTCGEPHVGADIAMGDRPGYADISNFELVCKRMKSISARVDIMCVSLHWGFEYFLYPSYDQVRVARLLADAGAQYVVCHHPHAIQGIEIYNDSLIMYSLGNFFFPVVCSSGGRRPYPKSIAKEFMIIASEFKGDRRITFEVVGGKTGKDHIMRPFEERKQEVFRAKVKKLSAPLMSDSYDIFWERYRKQRARGLAREGAAEAVKKLFQPGWRDYLRTLSIDDVKRNILRIKTFLRYNR